MRSRTPTLVILLVLMRVAVGWHLLYDGAMKVRSYSTDQPWTSARYLQNTEGPLAGLFRGLGASVGTVSVIDVLVVGGLIVGGACLILGFFTRPAAVAAAAMMLLFYLSMPPFPGLSAMLVGRSYYFFVNTQLMEMLALLVLAASHSGHWAGLDGRLHRVVRGPLQAIIGGPPSLASGR